MIHTEVLSIISQGSFASENITPQVQAVVDASGIQEGQAFVFYRHTTGALLMVEHEIGVMVDLEKVLEKLLPGDGAYTHHRRGFDENGAAHLRTALMNVSLAVPVLEGRLMLGKYQEILMLDMDTDMKPRQVVVQVMGA
jgi:secondary thiamine-phosphate synthase enzyme